MKTLYDFIAENGITMKLRKVKDNPAMRDMPAGSFHYHCKLHMDGRILETPFSCGPAWEKKPDVADVLSCLISDAGGFENNSDFDSYCREYGMDENPREAYRVFKNVEKQTLALKEFLGEKYEEALWETESL